MQDRFFRPITLLACSTALLLLGCEGEPLQPVEAEAADPALAPSASVLAGSEAAGSPDGDGVLHACYAPGSGTMYRIRADGAPESCRGGQHVTFSWHTGVAADQSCPDGEFVTGVDAGGGLLCAPPPTGGAVDADGDGFDASADCDDTDASIHPDATEIEDGIDNDCDGQVDEGFLTTWYPDADGDGFGHPDHSVESSTQPDGYVDNDLDCDDGDAAIYPGATEIEDGLDNDCDGVVDEGT